jgi:hypothetical protein
MKLVPAQLQRSASTAQRSRRVATPNKTINVGPKGNVQAALNAAQPGDTIVLEAGASYVGFRLPYKVGTGTDVDWITITAASIAPDVVGVIITVNGRERRGAC